MENPASRSNLDRIVLAPALVLAGLVVLLCATASFRVPLHGLIVPVEILLAIVFAAFLWQRGRSLPVRPLIGIGLLAVLASWLAMADYAGKWLPTAADILGPHPDSWSYQAIADYLDHYRRGRADGMPMVDEFARI